MTTRWEQLLNDWSDAGLVDASVTAQIRAFEETRRGTARWRWPMWLAVALGALMVAGGVLLFVAAHWDTLSPAVRFAIVTASVGLLHTAGAATTGRWPATGSALHAAGTVALGGGVFLAGQIFNMAEHWPSGFMLWTLGGVVAWALLRDWPQAVLLALVAPVWVASEWIVAAGDGSFETRMVSCGAFLTALAYFTNADAPTAKPTRRALQILGTVALLPMALALAIVASQAGARTAPGLEHQAAGWSLALLAPTLLALAFRRSDVGPNVAAAGWVFVLLHLNGSALPDIAHYGWWAIGALGLVAWGLKNVRVDRINLGVILFAATTLTFYFSEVMTKLGRSASLIGLGLLFLAGGWALERGRRRLVRETKGAQS